MYEHTPALTVEQVTPDNLSGVVDAVRATYEDARAVYPVGGGPPPGMGQVPRAGIALSLKGLADVIDFPARDMTVTVGAGITLDALSQVLAEEGLRLPLDAPRPESATAGGVVASNPIAPLCLGYGTMRDHVIGIEAVDASGTVYHGGGRVVKNIAGYDFCKLLTGSLGTLGVITQLSFKLKPLPETSRVVTARLVDLGDSQSALDAIAKLPTLPAAVELVGGGEWQEFADDGLLLAVRLEGTAAEVDWLVGEVQSMLTPVAQEAPVSQSGDEASGLWARLTDFTDTASLQIAVPAGAMCRALAALLEAAPGSAAQAHAASGIVLAKPPKPSADSLRRLLVDRLRPKAQAERGNAVLLRQPDDGQLDPADAFGVNPNQLQLMQTVKKQFDPDNRLNPGRFIF